eukprot:COSAG06_NODE_313_length_17764_cov_4.287235_15_plen_281_part_00
MPMAVVSAALALAAALAIAAAPSSTIEQDGNRYTSEGSGNTVELEHVRITVLTGALLRIEQRGARDDGGGYDDRPTLSFPYRSSAPHAEFTVTRPGPHQVLLRTANLTVHLNESTRPAAPLCEPPVANTDKVDGNRLKASIEHSQSDCCAACTAFGGCTAWVFGTDTKAGEDNCWLMAGVTETKPTTARIFGRVTRPPAFGLSVEYTATDGAPQRTWRHGDADMGNLNGTRHSLDCYVGTDAQAAASCLAPGLLERGLLSRDSLVLWEDTYRGAKNAFLF